MNQALILGAALLAAAAAATSAQAPLTGGAGAYIESYRFGDPGAAGFRSVTLLTVPIAAEARIGSFARLAASTFFASGRATRADGTDFTVSGLTDATVQLTVPVLQDRFSIAAAVNLPTGKSTYTQDEAQVAGIVAADLLPFRISNWGAGGSLDLSSQVATSMGGLNVGVRVGYQMGQEFDLVEDGSFSYRPGNQLYGRLAVDGNVGDSRAAAQVTFYTFSDDQINNQNLYKAGNRVQGVLTYSMPAGRAGRLQTYVGALRREHGTFLDAAAEETPAQTMLFLGSGLRRPFGRGAVVPAVDVRLLRSSDGEGQGFVAGAGVSLEIPMGGATFMPTARARFGNLMVRVGSESGITGFDVGAAIRFRGSR